MRTLKFRYWNTITKEMVNNPKMPYKENCTIEQLFEDRGWVWMQFTGLTDRHGMEIYEGDVVEHGSRDELDFGVGTVEWNREWACFELKCAYDWGDTHTSNEVITASREWRVIGNIYEHPGLLK